MLSFYKLYEVISLRPVTFKLFFEQFAWLSLRKFLNGDVIDVYINIINLIRENMLLICGQHYVKLFAVLLQLKDYFVKIFLFFLFRLKQVFTVVKANQEGLFCANVLLFDVQNIIWHTLIEKMYQMLAKLICIRFFDDLTFAWVL